MVAVGPVSRFTGSCLPPSLRQCRVERTLGFSVCSMRAFDPLYIKRAVTLHRLVVYLSAHIPQASGRVWIMEGPAD
jgi:hypothetical protein